MKNWRIRLAHSGDVAALSNIGKQSFAETFTHYPFDISDYLAREYSEEMFASYLREPQTTLWIAEDEKGALGYAKLGAYKLPIEARPLPVIELHRLYLIQRAQGRGMGKAFMNEIIETARTKANSLYLGVWENNVKAQTFYARYGFEKVGEYDYPPIGSVVDHEWIMRKSLERK